MKKLTLFGVAALAASVLALAGCSSGAPVDDGNVHVVASTDVYGQIAAQIGGDTVSVKSLISSPSQDPHEFEPSASDQLAVNRAGLILQNGAGYDAFMTGLIKASGTKAPVLTAAIYNSAWPGGDPAHAPDGFNEHVWYDPATMTTFATATAEELENLVPNASAAIKKRLATFIAETGTLSAELRDIATKHSGEDVFATEPVPVYMTEAAGLVDVTPTAFSEAVEAGSDVPPATLLSARDILRSGRVKVVVVNAQAGGAETTTVIDEAKRLGIPVMSVTETLPRGLTYSDWMQRNVLALAKALS
ncbi:metal ABC transporter solute-binding protein, Zn/Mn family [Microbacterium rhizosphaerae]|uniref:Zinc ABC transporter substrate-binding protein n=1 Tax=Microbacterium rhizosphaerae TaxID=1678237 RepID=A0ABZ0SKW8_9MICO|nr:zinc ABC transporter substrate-binding protein [Microbacterium rhizosphaerae]WPR90042.1 zinc ABC transporter substrate-binding protein [Microbacterium rhizosphaerae]